MTTDPANIEKLAEKKSRELNPYLRDALPFMRRAAATIVETMDDEVVVQGTLNFALGVERILKGILFDVNPVYILIRPEFKNSVHALYKQRLLPGVPFGKEIEKEPDEDVITFRESLARAQHLSAVTQEHRTLLGSLGAARDIIVHHDLQRVDWRERADVLLRDFFPYARAAADEVGIASDSFLGAHYVRLSSLAAARQATAEKKLSVLIASHRARWKSQGATPGYPAEMTKTTRIRLTHEFRYPFKCPACGNRAIIFGAPEFAPPDSAAPGMLLDVVVIALRCLFCKLEIRDPSVIDHLRLPAAVNAIRAETDQVG